MNKYKKIMNSEDLFDLVDNKEDLEKKNDKKTQKFQQKQALISKGKESSMRRRTDRILASCKFCIENKFILNEQILKIGSFSALIIPKSSNFCVFCIFRIFCIFCDFCNFYVFCVFCVFCSFRVFCSFCVFSIFSIFYVFCVFCNFCIFCSFYVFCNFCKFRNFCNFPFI